MEKHNVQSAAEVSTERLVYFSDAVIAIAVTLLVLDIKVPKADSAAQLLHALGAQWTNYISFFISFSVISVTWTNHHRMFTFINKVDHSLIVLNTLLLMWVVLIPFSTALLSEYLNKPGSYIGAAVYGGTLTVGGIFFNWLWYYATKNGRLLKPNADRAEVSALLKLYRTGPLLYFIAMMIAFINTYISLALYIALIIFFYIPMGVKKKTGGASDQ